MIKHFYRLSALRGYDAVAVAAAADNDEQESMNPFFLYDTTKQTNAC